MIVFWYIKNGGFIWLLPLNLLMLVLTVYYGAIATTIDPTDPCVYHQHILSKLKEQNEGMFII